jgi:hypothetical protein
VISECAVGVYFYTIEINPNPLNEGCFLESISAFLIPVGNLYTDKYTDHNDQEIYSDSEPVLYADVLCDSAQQRASAPDLRSQDTRAEPTSTGGSGSCPARLGQSPRPAAFLKVGQNLTIPDGQQTPPEALHQVAVGQEQPIASVLGVKRPREKARDSLEA